MSPTEPHATFHRRCGEILGISLSTEVCIENFITEYFFRQEIKKTYEFEDLILRPMNFNLKVALFKEICKNNKITDSTIKNTIRDLNFVRNTRNKIAHYLSTYEQLSDDPRNGRIILLRKKSSKVRGKDTLDVTDELVKEISVRYFSIMKGVVETHNRLIELEKKNDESNTISSTPQSFL